MNIAQESTKQASKKNTTDKNIEDNKPTDKFFQGIGVICGRIITDESQKTFIEIEGETFKLTKTKFIRQRLDPYIEKHPDKLVYLRVYPSFNIKSQRISFHAIGFMRVMLGKTTPQPKDLKKPIVGNMTALKIMPQNYLMNATYMKYQRASDFT